MSIPFIDASMIDLDDDEVKVTVLECTDIRLKMGPTVIWVTVPHRGTWLFEKGSMSPRLIDDDIPDYVDGSQNHTNSCDCGAHKVKDAFHAGWCSTKLVLQDPIMEDYSLYVGEMYNNPDHPYWEDEELRVRVERWEWSRQVLSDLNAEELIILSKALENIF